MKGKRLSNVNAFLVIAGILVLGVGLLVGFLEHIAVMYAALFAFFACLLAANLDRISEFKASATGVEAKTREVIAKAENAVSELQLLAKNVVELTLGLVKRSGRLSGYSDAEQESIKGRLLEVLQNVGIPKEELPQMMREWHSFTEFDYTHAILGNQLPDGNDPTLAQEWHELRHRGMTEILTPEELRQFLEKHNLLTTARAEYIEDYAHYRIHKSHRRPEIWQQRDQWERL